MEHARCCIRPLTGGSSQPSTPRGLTETCESLPRVLPFKDGTLVSAPPVPPMCLRPCVKHAHSTHAYARALTRKHMHTHTPMR